MIYYEELRRYRNNEVVQTTDAMYRVFVHSESPDEIWSIWNASESTAFPFKLPSQDIFVTCLTSLLRVFEGRAFKRLFRVGWPSLVLTYLFVALECSTLVLGVWETYNSNSTGRPAVLKYYHKGCPYSLLSHIHIVIYIIICGNRMYYPKYQWGFHIAVQHILLVLFRKIT
jgi:hypothetical protein